MSTITADQKQALDQQAVNNFREYLQIPSVHPDVDYEPCVTFLEKQAKSLGLPAKVISVVAGKPIVIITWLGKEPSLPAILLNSHMDVVPVFEEKWTYKPFSAHVDEKGNIYARGSQDMKCVGIQYLEAIRRLKLQGVTLRRTIHVSFVPDEETGGVDGMKAFVKTNDFKNLNIGFALDEGMASPTNEYPVFYAERIIWQMHIHCPGHPGHGSLLLENTAGEKVAHFLNKLYEFRKTQQQKLKENPNFTIGDVTTVNLTQVQGGVQPNVIPPEYILTVDARISITTCLKKFEEMVNKWCSEAGQGVYVEFEQKQHLVTPTKVDNSNSYWIAFKSAADELGMRLVPLVCPAKSDMTFVRDLGIPAIGFSPMSNTEPLLHRFNEHLHRDTFLKGINIYCHLIQALAKCK
ncbi:aminoacylase-1 isoform X3 [Diabrotica virgifera virgifera]|uniref:N-acyl-aliphatic-L-amino acid amidohydrolase n=1 Tax=Diabrotica virgifera virgifera TaxID=50390 RepID=A0A6P7GDZ9_DIAVI|nr:aminoacylase-1 isoform X3 [Diabrotica virgifera virgifera]